MVSEDPIYLATVGEDCLWRVDAFVLVRNTSTGLCLSIATAKWHMDARGELITREPPVPHKSDVLQNERRSAWIGTASANRTFALNLNAALITVRNNDGTTTPSEDELTAWRGLLAAAKHRQQNGVTSH